ncbi:MAG: ATP-binding protein [Candidatus Omnitrophota bacterium]
MKFNSIRFKISVLYIAILGVILIVYSSFLYLSLRYTLYDELDNELSGKAREIAAAIDSYVQALGYDKQSFNFAVKRVITFEGEHPEQDQISELERQWMQRVDKLDLKEDYINFLNSKGKNLVSSANLQAALFSLFPKELARLSEGKIILSSIKLEKRNLRAISAPFSYDDSERYIIQVVTSLKPVIHLLQVRLMHITISIPVILIFASFLGRFFASGILRPVVEITKTASKITHEDLSSRVKAEHVDEEMKYLVNAFNNMISRLERSFQYIAEFSSHVAHDLKTPLAIIRGESDVALRKIRDVAEYRRVIRVTLEETERMLRVIEDLLLLTKLDYRPEVFKFGRFDLIEFLWEIYEQSKILASQKGITVSIDMPQEPVYLSGDKLHLRRLFFNLIDNAIRFTPEHGRIDFAVKSENKKAVVSISDTGAGIAEEDLPKIFDRFFHADRTGQEVKPSTGLGLSIAQSIAKIHSGRIEVKSKLSEGSVFTVTLPLL